MFELAALTQFRNALCTNCLALMERPRANEWRTLRELYDGGKHFSFPSAAVQIAIEHDAIKLVRQIMENFVVADDDVLIEVTDYAFFKDDLFLAKILIPSETIVSNDLIMKRCASIGKVQRYLLHHPSRTSLLDLVLTHETMATRFDIQLEMIKRLNLGYLIDAFEIQYTPEYFRINQLECFRHLNEALTGCTLSDCFWIATNFERVKALDLFSKTMQHALEHFSEDLRWLDILTRSWFALDLALQLVENRLLSIDFSNGTLLMTLCLHYITRHHYNFYDHQSSPSDEVSEINDEHDIVDSNLVEDSEIILVQVLEDALHSDEGAETIEMMTGAVGDEVNYDNQINSNQVSRNEFAQSIFMSRLSRYNLFEENPWFLRVMLLRPDVGLVFRRALNILNINVAYLIHTETQLSVQDLLGAEVFIWRRQEEQLILEMQGYQLTRLAVVPTQIDFISQVLRCTVAISQTIYEDLCRLAIRFGYAMLTEVLKDAFGNSILHSNGLLWRG